MIKRKKILILCISLAFLILAVVGFFAPRIAYKRPYRQYVETCGLNDMLVYSVMKAESGFREDAVSRAGAVGLMQIMPATAEFVCERRGVAFEAEQLKNGEYNVKIGCWYLAYLLERFPVTETALCAYNAGEGTVAAWLKDKQLSKDGITLSEIPYEETREYVKKVIKFQKIYEILY